MTNPPREILFEMTQVGTIMRVTAIDAETGTEVVIQGPVNAGPSALQQVALKKLNYVIRKQQET